MIKENEGLLSANRILYNEIQEMMSKTKAGKDVQERIGIQEKALKNPDFDKKIIIEIINKSDYIEIIIIDNGTGFSETNLKNILKPYFTTKPKGSGLGLSIVNKIINDHDGIMNFDYQKIGAKTTIKFPKNVD